MIAILDLVIFLAVAISVALGVWRGLVDELMALAILILAVVAAMLLAIPLSGMLSPWLSQWTESRPLSVGLAFAGVFIVVLAVGSVLKALANKLVHASGLSLPDRLLGGGFGLLRAGILLVVAAVLVQPLVADMQWWQNSQLIPYLLQARGVTLELTEMAAGTLKSLAE